MSSAMPSLNERMLNVLLVPECLIESLALITAKAIVGDPW